MQYLNNVLELFAIVLDIGTNFVTNKITIDFSLIDDLLNNFCFHDSFFSYKFGNV